MEVEADRGTDPALTTAGATSTKSGKGEEPQADDNRFQQAIAAWRNINLNNLIPSLDSAAADLVSHQRDALVQRKDLAQKTKDFRKLDDAEKLNDFKSLLKAYQSYIDLITTQSKATHTAFLQVYSPLSEAPDPYPLLEASVDSLITVDETLPKVQEENQQLQKSVTRLTAQLESAESRLEQERSTRRGVEGSVEEKLKNAEASWKAVLKEKQDNWESKEKNLEEKISKQDWLVKELKASYDVSQRLKAGENADNAQHVGVTSAELEIVNSELERTNMRLAEVEARNEQLRLELAHSASEGLESKPRAAIEEDPNYLRLQSENSSLLRRLENTRFEKDAERRKLSTNIRNLEREVTNLKKDSDTLRAKTLQWGDYDNLKRELEVLKSIEFATGDDDDEKEREESEFVNDVEASPDDSNKKGETLEQLLLARNKKLSNELTMLRVSHQGLQSRLEILQEEISTNNMELEKSRKLTATLESDLEKIQQEATNMFPSSAMSVAGTYTSRYPQSSLRRGRPASPTSSIISGFDSHGSGSMREEGVGGGSGMLPMITAQRDRFKRKNTELENELQKQYQAVTALRSEVSSLQKDNLSLYEKTRYVSTYARGSPAYSASSATAIQISNDSGASSGMSLDSRYRPAYESSISPFAAFRGRESARVLRGLWRPERFVFRITKTVLATRTSRNLFAAYLFCIHMFILIMLFSSGGNTSHLQTVADIGKSGAGAIGAAGGPAVKRAITGRADEGDN